ncbi:aminotransferase family protein [Streptomyces wuyuanensis]|uniref:aminotransferase family protein n=1 Tax=Streptomyces wuyuanensis TaxID=1196353 RepID=UPI0034274727
MRDNRPATGPRRPDGSGADDARAPFPLLLPHLPVGRAPEQDALCLVRGSGALLWDSRGREFVDATGGLGQCAVGYGRSELADAAVAQMRELASYPLYAGPLNEPALLLAGRLAGIAPTEGTRVFFTNSGTEGVETALKLARLAHFHASGVDRPFVLSRTGAYHGNTGAALSVTGIDSFRHGLSGGTDGHVVRIGRPRAGGHPREGTDFLVAELRRKLDEIGPHRVGALIGEPVMGMAGMVAPPDDYWPRVCEVLDEHGILMIADEVATGYGRTGDWFASPAFGARPDLVVTAKALTSGYQPMGAVMAGRRVTGMLDGLRLLHGCTTGGHPTAAAVALANLDVIERERLAARARSLGAAMLGELAALEELPWVGEVRGTGLMLAVEIDRDAPELAGLSSVPRRAAEEGVLLTLSANRVRLTPPLVLTDPQAERVVNVVSGQVRRLGRRAGAGVGRQARRPGGAAVGCRGDDAT